MVKLVLPSVWHVDGQHTFEVPAGPLPAIIKGLVEANPSLRRRLLGPDGEPAGYINICVDEDLVPRQARAATVVDAGSTVTIMPPMAGG
ncbi:MoaD/ThiS family protein [Rhizomonospora bruguierae]|uniref:MoaD/ThiS family protein n=1 Tax=Rhizomonospora bruguierae TaxID=1581705 RepID=UPI0020C082B1|nr:MoaD/ThiS family protein [Micromonospora sp. NBRC 107566]